MKGIETASIVELHELDPSLASLPHARRYQATRGFVLRKAMKFLNEQLDLKHYDFVDVGCGKGRVLIAAGQYPFAKIVGIDFDKSLTLMAMKNLATVFKEKELRNFEVICMDILDYGVSSRPTIFYLFNPFDEIVLEKFLQNILKQGCPERPSYLIYVNPIRHKVIEKYRGLILTTRLNHQNSNNLVYIYRVGNRRTSS